MKIQSQMTDDRVLAELGGRLARVRLEKDLTQKALATQAGVGVRTVQRLESGEVATQLGGFLRVCRALGLLERLDALIPEALPSPMEQLKRQGRKRKRASGEHKAPETEAPEKWSWGEPS